ncbi:flavodoxin domain-containing protein [Mycolicibacterium porcinum]|uniref:Flavodoxin domain-containing protein n=1 Tax=Mycolicibacterium porcinum TaxID=39693 RepID=A0AAW5TF20_9MYCO|nr:flavodoxin domain-containing protein [Mycolicibacterium porcinum]MCV7392963.1 flavodoxin domain-containing protein [Mycolicibacterium porcinum]ORB33629.1 nitric oxide synthase [Mycolicibacterium porcinum]CDO31007.1 fdhF [Mycolicibacterium vulneris]
MSTITVLFGTESGNSEMVADDICKQLAHRGIQSEVVGMEDYHVGRLPEQRTIIIVTSTYGEGDLPETAEPFFNALTSSKPDLSAVQFAAFGLGDSSYDTYNRGIRTLTQTFADLGATQIGETGFHDADSGLDPSQVALEWLAGLPMPQAKA